MEIEIPFGAKDSELQEWSYTIPKGYTAEIKDGKVTVKLIKSEDERIRNVLLQGFISMLSYKPVETFFGEPIENIISYLEKQENPSFVYNTHDYVSARKQGLEQYSKKNFIDNQSKFAFEKGFEAGYMFGIHEEKPFVWTKHDEAVHKEAIACLEDWKDAIIRVGGLVDYKNILAWLKEELPEKQKEQKSKWSEEDEIYLQDALWCVKQASKVARGENDMGACWSAERWLKSLPERLNLQPKQEWSDEDKWTIDLTIAVLRENLPNEYFKSTPTNDQNIGAIHTEELVKKLESLKNRGNSPKSNTNSPWKPSEEQMNALKRVVYNRPIGSAELNSLESLYKYFKKLM